MISDLQGQNGEPKVGDYVLYLYNLYVITSLDIAAAFVTLSATLKGDTGPTGPTGTVSNLLNIFDYNDYTHIETLSGSTQGMWLGASNGNVTISSTHADADASVRLRAGKMIIADENGNQLWKGTAQEMANALTPPIKIQKFSKSVTIGANAFTTTDLGTISVPTGYNFLGIVANENGYGDQWLVSYSWYGGKCQAMIHSRHNASLTKTLIARAIFIRSDLNT